MAASGTGKTLRVLSANICILPTGLRNRPLAILTLSGSSVAVALCLAACWPGFVAASLVGPLLFLVVALMFGMPLARLAGALLCFLFPEYNDFKRERIHLFLNFLAYNRFDVVCLQECFDSFLLPSGHIAALVEGAKLIGYTHVAPSNLQPSLWTCFGMNGGVMILSRVPIRNSSVLNFSARCGFEYFAVSRSALHCELENGVHIVTCHLSPAAENCGPLRYVIEGHIESARRSQAEELAAFIQRRVGWGVSSPIVLAGDLNLSVQFDEAGHAVPLADAHEVLCLLGKQCDMSEMSTACRASAEQLKDSSQSAFAFLRPTCGFTGADFEGGPPETWLATLVGDGAPKHVCEDAVLFRGLTPVSMEEVALHIETGKRPNKELTHISDHWAIQATFTFP